MKKIQMNNFQKKTFITITIALLIIMIQIGSIQASDEKFANPIFPIDVIDTDNGDESGVVKIKSLTAITYGGNVSYYKNGGEDYTGSHYGTNYRAVDISFYGCEGKEVYAVEQGVVVNIVKEDGMVIIKHTKPLALYDDSCIYKEWYTIYAHMKDIKVRINQTVEKKTIIGRISNTNYKKDSKMAKHLHFAITTKLYNDNASFHYAYKYAKNKDSLKEYSNATISPYWLKGSFRNVNYVPYSSDIADASAINRILSGTSIAPESTYTIPSVNTEKANEEIASLNSGEYIYLGKFEQDNNLNNGKEMLLWRVLSTEDDKALIICDKIIDTVSMGKGQHYTWEGSPLQQWCRNFINDTTNFSRYEKELIADTRLSDTGTTEKVFFLSSDEISKYCKDIRERLTDTTAYTPSDMSISDYSGPDTDLREMENNMKLSKYWLRSYLSPYWIEVADGNDGSFETCINLTIANSTWGVRPACYIDLTGLKIPHGNGTFDNPYMLNDSNNNQPSFTNAKPTSSKVMINGVNIAFEAYNINGNNYFKLRDLAKALNESEKKFEITWDGVKKAINILTNQSYTSVGGELFASGNTNNKNASLSASKIFLNGAIKALTAYNIDGNNYFKLRDIGKVINFAVTWDGTNNTINIDTTKNYIPE